MAFFSYTKIVHTDAAERTWTWFFKGHANHLSNFLTGEITFKRQLSQGQTSLLSIVFHFLSKKNSFYIKLFLVKLLVIIVYIFLRDWADLIKKRQNNVVVAHHRSSVERWHGNDFIGHQLVQNFEGGWKKNQQNDSALFLMTNHTFCVCIWFHFFLLERKFVTSRFLLCFLFDVLTFVDNSLVSLHNSFPWFEPHSFFVQFFFTKKNFIEKNTKK